MLSGARGGVERGSAVDPPVFEIVSLTGVAAANGVFGAWLSGGATPVGAAGAVPAVCAAGTATSAGVE
ncbi:MAG: hypothetical protein ACREVW_15340, partial [Burkholderiales bacterium]